MKLRYSPTSPYVRKVVATAIEVGLDERIERIGTNPWDPQTDLPSQNPLGKVPALVLGDGSVLYDSPVICEYLNAYAGGDLLPQGSGRWEVLRLQSLGDGILDAAVLRVLEGRRPEQYQYPEWQGRQKSLMERALDTLEGQAEGFSDRVDLGLIAVAAALGYVDFRFPDDQWREGRAGLASWYEGFAQRPSMRDTVPKDPS